MNAKLAAVAAAAQSVVEQLEGRVLLSGSSASSTWTILGDLSRRHPNDSIVVGIDPATHKLRARINGISVGSRWFRGLSSIEIGAGRGNDRVSVELGEAGQGITVAAWGGQGDDKMIGDAGNQVFYGNQGHDTLDAAGGDDSLYGGAGDDDLFGGDDADYLNGQEGNDTLSGGWGTDRLLGESGSDQIDGGEGRDKIDAGPDKDTLRGGAGRDASDGGAGRDWLYVEEDYDTYSRDSMDRLRGDDGRLPMQRRGQAELRQKIRELSLSNWESYLGKQLNYGWWNTDAVAVALNSGSPVPGNSGSGAPNTPTADHSNTNVQEEGVDEADLVETDGNYLYALIGNELVVTDARTYTIVHRQTLEGSPMGLYLRGDRLTVLSWQYDGGPVEIDESIRYAAGFIIPTRYREFTRVDVLDVSDPSAPQRIERTELDGDYVSSRAIGDRVYVVTAESVNTVVPKVFSDGHGNLVYESRDSYLGRLDAAIDEAMPGYEATAADGTVTRGLLLGDDDLWTERDDSWWWYQPTITVTLLNTADGDPDIIAHANVSGWGGQIYVSADSLYIAESDWASFGNQVNLYKFSLGNDSVVFSATGIAPGRVLNQFSMDEEGSYIRIATTEGSGQLASNGVFVLDQVAEELRTVGSVEDIAPGEQIYAARFMGNRAYLVTFVRTDPLFTIDLSDPTAPEVLGELIIPGFSNYLHPIDANHLIGIGQTGTWQSQVSLFDVGDPTDPQRVDVYTPDSPSGWSWSSAEYDHHAFSYFPESGILAFPVSLYKNGRYESHLEVLRIQPEEGIEPLGAVVHQGTVLRSVRIGQNLFSIGTDAIEVVKLEDPDQAIASIPI